MTAIQPCNDPMDAETSATGSAGDARSRETRRWSAIMRKASGHGCEQDDRVDGPNGRARVVSPAYEPSRRWRPVHLLLTVLVTTWLASPASAQSVSEAGRPCTSNDEHAPQRILATVTGARRIAGNITFTLYGSRPVSFLAHNGSIAIDRITLTGVAADACFVVSTPGVYALAVYHDENNNHHFDRSLIGLPVEGYGFSNNATIFMAPPSFASARFTVRTGDNHLTIKLRY